MIKKAPLLIIMAAAAISAQAQGPQVSVSEKLLGQLFKGASTDDMVVSPDSAHFAYFVYNYGKNKWAAVVDGKPGRLSDSAIRTSFVFSADGSRYGYLAIQGDKIVLVVDNELQPPWDKFKEIVFSPDSKRLAYSAVIGKKQLVVVDGVAGVAYDEVGGIIFSPDSRRIAYSAREGKEWHVLVDGREEDACTEVGEPTFSPDSKHVAYWASSGAKYLMMQDGVSGPLYDGIGNPVFSSNADLAYGVLQGAQWHFANNGKLSPPYEGLLEKSETSSPDGRHLAYAVVVGGKVRVVRDGKLDEAIIDAIGELRFSPDGQHLAYKAKTNGKWHMTYDGAPGPAFDGSFPPIFSPDSAHFAYSAQDGGQWRVIADGKPGPVLPSVQRDSLTYSPDSKHLLYEVDSKTKSYVSVDGFPQKAYDLFLIGTKPTFDSPNSFHTIAFTFTGIYLVEFTIGG
jgi:Tol biopolymer transport system component